jgi:hypothetical protein
VLRPGARIFCGPAPRLLSESGRINAAGWPQTNPEDDMLKTYHGRCHCRAVTFEADLDLAAGASRCNCTFCRKTRNWSARTVPEHLRIVGGAERITWYDVTGQGINAHAFCATCGVRLFTRGDIPELGGAFVSVALAVLEDAQPEELIAAPLTWCDGLHDNWWHPPAEVRHL